MSSAFAARWLYLSPHLDDVALSCGGQIARATRDGVAVDIVTIFAGDEPGPAEEAASPLVAKIYALWELAAGEVMATRRREDLAACRELAAQGLHWELQEAIHRRAAAGGEALYPTLERLFGAVAATSITASCGPPPSAPSAPRCSTTRSFPTSSGSSLRSTAPAFTDAPGRPCGSR